MKRESNDHLSMYVYVFLHLAAAAAGQVVNALDQASEEKRRKVVAEERAYICVASGVAGRGRWF